MDDKTTARLEHDKSFAHLWPICEVMGLDAHAIVDDLRAMARKLRLNEMDLVLAKRRELVEKMNNIRRLSD